MLASAEREVQFLVDGLITANSITVIAGEGGSGKSWLAFDLAVACMRSRSSWMGAPVLREGPVLLYTLDNPTPVTATRFARLGLNAADPLHYHSFDADPVYRLPAFEKQFLAQVEHLKPALIVIDSLRHVHAENENDNQRMTEVMLSFKRARDKLGASVVLVHHVTKLAEAGDLARIRGATEIVNSSDVAVVAQKTGPNTGKLSWVKHRGWLPDEATNSAHYKIIDKGDQSFVQRVAK